MCIVSKLAIEPESKPPDYFFGVEGIFFYSYRIVDLCTIVVEMYQLGFSNFECNTKLLGIFKEFFKNFFQKKYIFRR